MNPFEDRRVPASLSGSVYQDLNNDGVRDCTEPGIAGVTIQLVGRTECGQIICQDTVTDCEGNYAFGNLPAGDYTVIEKQPAGFKDGKDTPGSAGGIAVCGDMIVCVHLNNCTDATGYIFGEQPACSNHGHDKCGDPPKGNNGVGNGLDPQPPGNPPMNDGPGTLPGDPGNRGGK